MKKNNSWFMVVSLAVFFLGLWMILWQWNKPGTTSSPFQFSMTRTPFAKPNGILHLQLKGVIVDGKKFLEPLKELRENKNIAAVVIEIASPGGVVGPSQEIYEEIRRTREEIKKPVVAFSSSVMASGGYYAAAAADKIVVAPGVMTGSIGVIMEFFNMQGLYDFAKVSRYSINTGKYKDSGAEYRQMRDDEKQLFQALVDDVYEQFIEAITEGRNLKDEQVRPFADGRVLTGRQAIEASLVDELGTLEDAFRLAADLAGVKDFEVVEPPPKELNFFDFLFQNQEDEATTRALGSLLKAVFPVELMNRPLYLMPGAHFER